MLGEVEKEVILGSLPGAAYRSSVEPPWRMDFISAGVERLCGYKPSDFTGGTIAWADLIHPDDLAMAASVAEKAAAAGEAYSLTYRMRTASGAERWVLERGKVMIESGKPKAFVGFIMDISDQKQVELQLAESEAHYRAAQELSPQHRWLADADGTLLPSATWLKLPGVEEGFVPTWPDDIHPDDRERAVAAWDRSLTSGEPLENQFRTRLPNGSYRWTRARAVARIGPEGEVLRWYGTLEDVHDQVEAEHALREIERRYALAAHATGDVIWDWDLNSGTVHRIGSPYSATGYDDVTAEESGEHWRQGIHPDDRERIVADVQRLVDGEVDRSSREYRLRRPDGRYAHVLDRCFLVRDEDGRPARMVGVTQDISERVATEEKVRQLQAELLHMSRLSAMDTMATTLAHELNQPLTASANYVTASRRLLSLLHGDDKPAVAAGLQEAEAQIHRAGEIIRRVRTMIANPAGRQETVSLRSLVGRVTKLVEATQSCVGLSVRTHIEADADAIRVDPIQIEQVLLNLVRNGAEAMRDSPEPALRISSRRLEDGLIEVRVRDRGCGIDEQRLETLFTAFSNSTTGGLGVGLSICRTIVEAHQGRIWAETPRGGGATFCFTVPAAA